MIPLWILTNAGNQLIKLVMAAALTAMFITFMYFAITEKR